MSASVVYAFAAVTAAFSAEAVLEKAYKYQNRKYNEHNTESYYNVLHKFHPIKSEPIW